MPHATDFPNAHRRHWDDAELLFEHRRWAAADQLYGFSAECGLKAVMRAHGVSVAKKHVQDFWPIFEAFLQGPSGARYRSLLPGGAPFADWSHHDRYAHGRHSTRRSWSGIELQLAGFAAWSRSPRGASHDEPDHPVR